ncbi:MAG: hypothetical protein ACI9XU_000586 [Arenicella sp.]|jgi:hypothetical protein
MIRNALNFIKQQLDEYLSLHFDLDESAVVINSLLDLDGGVSKKNQNKVVVTMINLDHETSRQYSTAQRKLNSKDIAEFSPAQYFNIDLLFTANFDDYEESLKFLTRTISFFQANMSFNANNLPGMPRGVSKLNFQIENSSFLETHNLWSAMGAKYQPSIIYKIRHISIDSEQVSAIKPSVTRVAATAS